jgi:hypothetical protein
VTSNGLAATSINVTWTTDKSSGSNIVFYGATSAYGSQTMEAADGNKSHTVALSGLTASSTYHAKVQSTCWGQVANGSDWTFTTPSASVTLFTTNYDTTSTWTAGKTNHLVSLPANSFLVVCWADTGANLNSPTIGSNPALTWVTNAIAKGVNSGNCSIMSAVFAAGGDIYITNKIGANVGENMVYVFTGTETVPAGVTRTNAAVKPATSTITTTRNNSVVVGVISDFTPTTGAATWNDSPTIQLDDLHGGVARFFFFTETVAVAGATTIGLTAPTGSAQEGICLLEVRTP